MSFKTSEYLGKLAYLTTDESDEEVTVKKVGRVHFFVFHQRKCVGMLVKRPDLAMMIHRKDIFAPLNAVYFQEKAIILDADYENKANAFLKENKIKLSQTFVWDGMTVDCENGKSLGTVDCVVCADTTGKLIELHVSDSVTSDKLLGVRVLPSDLVLGMRMGTGTARLMTVDDKEDEGCGVLCVRDEASKIPLTGGAAEKLAVSSAKAKDKAIETAIDVKKKAVPATKKAKAAASTVIDAGVKKAGRDSATIKKGVVGFKDEFMKSFNGEEK